MEIIFDTKEMSGFADKLKAVHKSAYPVAIRQTLTEAAKITKTKTLIRETSKQFKKRDPNFFKANSTFEPAKGFDVKRMSSAVGMYQDKVRNKATNHAVEDLEQREHGGKIAKRAFIPQLTARTSKNFNKRVAPRHRMDKLKGVKITEMRGRGSLNHQFIRAAAFAFHKGNKLMFGKTTKSGGRTLFRVDKFDKSKGKLNIKLTPLYNIKKGRSIDAKATHFMENSARRGAKVMPHKFKSEFERLFKKYTK